MDTPQLNDNDNKDTDLAAGVATWLEMGQTQCFFGGEPLHLNALH